MEISKVVIAFALALLPAIGWLLFYYHKDYKDPEPKELLFKTFLAGVAIATPFLFIRGFLSAFPELSTAMTGVFAVFLFAALEEMAKLTATIYIVTRNKGHFNQVIDGVIYAVTAALGFAFVENQLYFYEFLKSGTDGILGVFLFRGLGTMLAHTLFSGLAGFIWAYAYFSKKISPFNKKGFLGFELKDFFNREIITLHIIRRNILISHPSRRGGHEKKILVLEGIFLATILHAIFNLTTTFEAFGKNLSFLLVPALMGGLVYLSFLFTKKRNHKVLKVV